MLSDSRRIVSSGRFEVSQIGRRFRNPLMFLAADRRQVRPEPLFIELQQHVPVFRLLAGHLLEDAGGSGIALVQVLREGLIDTAVLLFAGNGDGQDFAFCQCGKALHGTRLAQWIID